MKGLLSRIRRLRRRDGYVLAWMLCFFLVVALISTVTITAAVMSTQTTANQHNARQAAFSARSAAMSTANFIIKNASNPQLINSLMNQTGTGGDPRLGEYTVDVSYVNQNKIRIQATATYKGQTATVSAYLVRPPAPSGIIPTDNVIYVNGSAATGFGQCRINGDVYIDGDLNLAYGSTINGFAVVKGNASITGNGSSTTGLFSFGNVHLGNSGKVFGDVMAKGDLKLDGSGLITGNAYADGSLDMGGSGTIQQDATIGNNASFSGGSNKIHGQLYYGGTTSTAWGSLKDFVPQGGVKLNSYTPIDDGPYVSQPLPIIVPPTQAQMPQLYQTVTISNKTISNSGTITSAVVSQINSHPWGSTITIDATQKDIHLRVHDTAMNLSNGINLEVVSNGEHNVYLYLTGSSSLSINANQYVGMQVRGSNPRLFIFGDGQQSISLNSNSELDACVYMPKGSISASGSPLTTYKFVGVCIVEKVNITSNVLFHYSPPDIENTPLDIFTSGAGGGGSSAWVLESWSD